MSAANSNVSYVAMMPVNGYQDWRLGEFNPWDVCCYYLVKETTDYRNAYVPIALSSAHQQSHYACHGWRYGQDISDAKDLAQNQQLSMQDLYDWWGKDPLPEHPVYTNQQITNALYVGVSLIIDLTQGNPHRVPDGIWHKMLNGGNINGWNMVEQDNSALWVEGWPPKDPRNPPRQGQGQGKP